MGALEPPADSHLVWVDHYSVDEIIYDSGDAVDATESFVKREFFCWGGMQISFSAVNIYPGHDCRGQRTCGQKNPRETDKRTGTAETNFFKSAFAWSMFLTVSS